MKRALLGLALLLAACGGDASTGPEPDALAMSDPIEGAQPETEPEKSTMRFDIGREPFVLEAGICNTYDDGTFKFALAEGELETGGRVTATIERFDTGIGYEMILALEGLRSDGSSVRWYAQESIDVHAVSTSVFGPTAEGTALFASEGGSDAAGVRADGAFLVSCVTV